MPVFTVIGVHQDNGLSYCEHVEATDAFNAMNIAASAQSSYDMTVLQIIGAFEGAYTLIPACEESGAAAYACDLPVERGDI